VSPCRESPPRTHTHTHTHTHGHRQQQKEHVLKAQNIPIHVFANTGHHPLRSSPATQTHTPTQRSVLPSCILVSLPPTYTSTTRAGAITAKVVNVKGRTLPKCCTHTGKQHHKWQYGPGQGHRHTQTNDSLHIRGTRQTHTHTPLPEYMSSSLSRTQKNTNPHPSLAKTTLFGTCALPLVTPTDRSTAQICTRASLKEQAPHPTDKGRRKYEAKRGNEENKKKGKKREARNGSKYVMSNGVGHRRECVRITTRTPSATQVDVE